MAPSFTMPTDAETRRLAFCADVSATVSAIRCALTLVDGTALPSAERVLLQAIDRELSRLARAASERDRCLP